MGIKSENWPTKIKMLQRNVITSQLKFESDINKVIEEIVGSGNIDTGYLRNFR